MEKKLHLCILNTKKPNKKHIETKSMKPLIAITLLTSLTLLCSCQQEKKTKSASPIRVKVEELNMANQTSGQTYVGIVEEREATSVSFTSMGVIRRMLVHEGQYVKRGQLLAEIDATTSENSVEAAKANISQANDMVEQAQSIYLQAKDAYDRMKLLHDNGSLPEIKWVEAETRLKQAETTLNTAKSNIKSAQATERIARKNQADTRLIAPVSGIIGKRQKGAGETALPSEGVVTILDISTVKVKVSVPETEMKEIGTHSSTHIFVKAADLHANGGTIEKGVQADAMTHTYDIRINVPNASHQLLPGMVADVSFTSAGAKSSEKATVAVNSVQRRADGSLFIWTIDKDNTAHRTTVTIGETEGNRVAITSGLNYGQRIVTDGYQKLSEGTKVTY